MEYIEKEKILMEALLSQEGLQSLLNTAAKLMGNPMFITDLGNSCIVASDTKYVEDIGWTMINISVPDQGVGVRDACLEEIVSSGALEATAAADTPYIRQYAFSAFRYVSIRLSIDGNLVGYLIMIECFEAYMESDRELFQLIAKVLSFEMKSYGQPRMRTVRYYSLISELLAMDHTISMKQYDSRASQIGLKIPGTFRVIVIQPQLSEMEIQLFHLRSLFLQRFPGCLGIIYGAQIILIVDGKITTEKLSEKLSFELKRFSVNAGISSLNTSPLKLNIAYQQAQAAIDVGLRYHPRQRIFRYADYAMRHIAVCACEKYPAELYYCPQFNTLLQYDLANHTAFVNDLDVYLECGKTIGLAAAKLNIHKNSMYYRVAKIEEICNCSLKEYKTTFELQMSLHFYKADQVLKGQV